MTTAPTSSTSPSSSAAPSVFTSAIGWTYLVLNALDVLLALVVILHILKTGYRSRRTRRLSLQTRELLLNPSADVTVTIRELGAAVTVARRMPLAVCTGVAIGGVVRLVLASVHTIWLTPIIVTVFAMHALIVTVVQQSFDLDRHNLLLVLLCAALSIASWAPSKLWLIHGRTDSEIVKTWPDVSRRVALVSLAYFAVLSMNMILAVIGVSYQCSRQDVRPSQTDMKLPRLFGAGFAAEKERRAFENRRNHQIRYLERLAARRVVSWSLTLLAQCCFVLPCVVLGALEVRNVVLSVLGFTVVNLGGVCSAGYYYHLYRQDLGIGARLRALSSLPGRPRVPLSSTLPLTTTSGPPSIRRRIPPEINIIPPPPSYAGSSRFSVDSAYSSPEYPLLPPSLASPPSPRLTNLHISPPTIMLSPPLRSPSRTPMVPRFSNLGSPSFPRPPCSPRTPRLRIPHPTPWELTSTEHEGEETEDYSGFVMIMYDDGRSSTILSR